MPKEQELDEKIPVQWIIGGASTMIAAATPLIVLPNITGTIAASIMILAIAIWLVSIVSGLYKRLLHEASQYKRRLTCLALCYSMLPTGIICLISALIVNQFEKVLILSFIHQVIIFVITIVIVGTMALFFYYVSIRQLRQRISKTVFD